MEVTWLCARVNIHEAFLLISMLFMVLIPKLKDFKVSVFVSVFCELIFIFVYVYLFLSV